MKHKEKVKLAIRMAGKVKPSYPGKKFMSDAWTRRKKAIADRVKRKQDQAHQRALARKVKDNENKNMQTM